MAGSGGDLVTPNGQATPPERHDATIPIRIGSRNSRLALIQTHDVLNLLKEAHPGFKFEISTILVRGDEDKKTPLILMTDKIRASDIAKNLWTEEMEEKLCAGELDMLIHSLKDMPTVLPPSCLLGAAVLRTDPTDALVMKQGLPYKSLDELPDGAVVGTSSTRRKAMLKRSHPHLVVRSWRGNVDTRVRKLDADDAGFSAIIVATAGLIRIGLADRISCRLSPLSFPYAVGQGALGVEIRANDMGMLQLLKSVEDPVTRWKCLAERAMLRTLEGGCSSPVGVACFSYKDTIQNHDRTTRTVTMVRLHGWVIHPHGWSDFSTSLSREIAGDEDAEALGVAVAEALIKGGAGDLLAQIQRVEASGYEKFHMKQVFDQSMSTADFRQGALHTT